MKKIVLLLVAVIGLSPTLFSQTDGWFQYTIPRIVNQMVKDAENNLHIATDVGYIKFNTTSNSVETFFNLTSQSPGVGNCSSVAVNPVNGNVALGYPLWAGISISNGTTIVEYHAENTAFSDSFQTPRLYYASDGTLYIYERTSNKYQTFKDGVFSDVKTVGTTYIYGIVENNDGTKVYFATNTGLWELVKATGVFTNYTTANSDLLSDTVNVLFVDTNNVLHIGSKSGLNTLTPAGVWESFQEQVGTTNTFFAVYAIDKNTEGKVLVSNSSGFNSNQFSQVNRDGYSIIDTTTGDWTRYDFSTFCDNDNFIANILFIEDTLYCNFANFSKGHHRLWSFDIGGGGCTEYDLNYQGIDLLSSAGMYDVIVRNNPNDNTKLDISLVNGTYYSWILKTMTISKDFNGTFPSLTTTFTNTNTDRQPLKTLIRLNTAVFASERDGIWIINDDGTSTFLPHNMSGFRTGAIKRIGTRNTNGGSSDNKITLAIDGYDSNYERRVYKTECDIDTQTCDTYTELFTDRNYANDITYECTDDLYPDELSCAAVITESGTSGKDENRRISGQLFTVEFWSYSDPTPVEKFKDDVSDLNPSIYSPVFFLDTDNPNLDGTDSYNPQPCFSENIIEEGQNNQKCRKPDGTYEDKKFDVDGNDEADELRKEWFYIDTTNVENDPFVFFKSIITLFKRTIIFNGENGKKAIRGAFAEYIAARSESGGRNTQTTFQYNVLTDASITLPMDFTFKSNIINFVYSDTYMATILNSNYGLLIKPKLNYTLLTLDVNSQSLENTVVNLSPNPAISQVRLSGADFKKIEVFDSNGRKIIQTNTATFLINKLAKGMYIVRATTTNNKVITKKLIKNY